MSRPWLRLYSEFVTDPKVQLLDFGDQRHYVCLLCLKCSGVLDSAAPSDDYRNKMLAKALGLDLTSALEARRRLVEVGLIDASWQPVKWDARQYQHDHSTDRVRRFRERKSDVKRSVKRSETVSETGEIRSEQNRTDGTRARASAPSEGATRAPILAPGEARQVLDRILEGVGNAAGR